MKERLRHWAATVDGLGLRERIFLLISVVAVLFLFMDSLVYQPAVTRQRRMNDGIDNLQRQLTVLETASRELAQVAPLEPFGWRERRLEELETRRDELDARIRDQLGLVVDPRQAARMLRDILERDRDLTLLELTTGTDRIDLDQALPGADAALPANLGRYPLTLRLEGSYLAALHFLEQLEQLPWALFYDSIDIRVQQHPRALIELQLYTLGASGVGS